MGAGQCDDDKKLSECGKEVEKHVKRNTTRGHFSQFPDGKARDKNASNNSILGYLVGRFTPVFKQTNCFRVEWVRPLTSERIHCSTRLRMWEEVNTRFRPGD
ncbi:hypothetical protein WG66_014863 [Moniliophthora roreri]|nr:hypothetical protein WG66_014863 [Moniliophthora roreri]